MAPSRPETDCMTFLDRRLRTNLENAVKRARKVAEAGGAAVMEEVGYGEGVPAGLDDARKALRRRLLARGRQLGQGLRTDGDGRTDHEVGRRALREEIAYEQWHRMLFARFLADNDLLRDERGTPVTLADCADLWEDEGALDAWDLAARYAAAMLPGLFRAGDVAAGVRLARETRAALERELDALPVDVFRSDDGLGWVYQFWQSDRKDEVNAARASGAKVGAAELPAVTQLFTEEYMVRFLLENTLGAWWAGKRPDSPLLDEMRYLRWPQDATAPRIPAAGTFDGWAATARELRVLDPCCGSGHFLTVAFDMLRRMRMEEDPALSEGAAADAVLRDNLFGLELDRRCTQIAMFNVALAAWRVGGDPVRNVPQVACSGTPVRGQLYEWQRVAQGDDEVEAYIEKLYEAFADAPVLGSLIDPHAILVETGLQHRRTKILPGVERSQLATHVQTSIRQRGSRQALAVLMEIARRYGTDPELAIFADSAGEVALSASILAGRYDLIVTNPPFKGVSDLDPRIGRFVEQNHGAAKRDLATVFLSRCLGFGEAGGRDGGTVAAVTPQNWLFLGAYKKLREDLLVSRTLDAIAVLGEKGFESSAAAGAFTSLVALTARGPLPDATFMGIDASAGKAAADKDRLLREGPVVAISQAAQERNPSSIVALAASQTEERLAKYANAWQGISSSDGPWFTRKYWEIPVIEGGWFKLKSTVEST